MHSAAAMLLNHGINLVVVLHVQLGRRLGAVHAHAIEQKTHIFKL